MKIKIKLNLKGLDEIEIKAFADEWAKNYSDIVRTRFEKRYPDAVVSVSRGNKTNVIMEPRNKTLEELELGSCFVDINDIFKPPSIEAIKKAIKSSVIEAPIGSVAAGNAHMLFRDRGDGRIEWMNMSKFKIVDYDWVEGSINEAAKIFKKSI